MFWIEEYFSLEDRIKCIDEQIIHFAQTSYAISTEKASKKIIDLITKKKELINEYIEYKLEFDKIDPKKKAVFELRYKENKTRKEIAQQLQISERTISRWISATKELK